MRVMHVNYPKEEKDLKLIELLVSTYENTLKEKVESDSGRIEIPTDFDITEL